MKLSFTMSVEITMAAKNAICKLCYIPPQRRLEKDNFNNVTSDNSTEVIELKEPEDTLYCFAKPLIHTCATKAMIRSETAQTKICPHRETKLSSKQSHYFCNNCKKDICNQCLIISCSSHNVLFLGTLKFTC